MASVSSQLRHDSVSSTSDSLMTSDDRAELLCGYWLADPAAAVAAVDPSKSRFDGATSFQARSTVVDNKYMVYTITDDSLPSHMRSLLPSHEQHVHDLLTLERTRRRLRHVIVGLSLLLTLAMLVALTLVFSLRVKAADPATVQRGLPQFAVPEALEGVSQITEVDTEVKVSLMGNNRRDDHSLLQWPVYSHSAGADEQRTPCLRDCWAYAAFRFRSECNQGYCQCRGDNYNPLTCLPEYKSCVIRRQPVHEGLATYQAKTQTTYGCRAPPSQPGHVHVVSLFGNHRSPTTHLTLRGQSAKGSTLVLVSYHFVKWTVHLPTTSVLSRVYVISMKTQLESDCIEFQWLPAADQAQPETTDSLAHPEVKVHFRMALTGYGEDKNGGHTPKLLQYVDEILGPVTSFLGAAHADIITLDLDEEKTESGPVTSANTETSSARVSLETTSLEVSR